MYQELVIALTGAAPVAEVRGAIPLALGMGFPPLLAYMYAVVGNTAVILPLLLFLRYGSSWARTHSKAVDHLLIWVFNRTQHRHERTIATIGPWALFVFVAIPLPLTGAWSACIIAFLCAMSLRSAFIAIALGVCVAGGLVLALSLGISTLMH